MTEVEPDREKLIEEIRNWLNVENIKNARKDREMMVRFLNGCKHQIPKVKTKMQNYYAMRRSNPELFSGRDPFRKDVETLLDLGALFPLPIKDSEGRTLMLVKAAANDPYKTPMTDVFKVGVMSVDLALELDETIAEKGVAVIIDLTGVGLGHAFQMRPSLISKMVHLWQDCYPVRINSIDFINCPQSIYVVLNIFIRFMKENLRKRLRTHGANVTSLHSVIDCKLLPEEYGGDLGPSSTIIEEWKRKVQNNRKWFLEDETVRQVS